MKSWFILLTWICVASPVLAFRGQVVSEDGEPIAGAVVSIVVQAGSSRTDPQGEFVWEPDPPQPFEILVALPKGQYASPVLIEKLEDGRDLIVRIRPVFELAVNVVALDDASPLDDVPARSLSLMLRQDLAAPGHVFVRGMVFGVDDEPGPTERHIAGYGIVDLGGGWRFGEDLEVTVYDGKHHPVDSDEVSFKLASSHAFREAFLKAKPILLEPIYSLTITVPEEFMGDVMGDLTSRRGLIIGTDADGHFQIIRADVPLAEIDRYATSLRSMSHGKGLHTQKFERYEEVPHEIVEKIVAESKKEKEAA